MDVELIFKIAAVGIIVAVLTQLLIRSGREEQAMLTSLAGLIVVLTLIITQISTLFNTIKQLFVLFSKHILNSSQKSLYNKYYADKHSHMPKGQKNPPT